MDRHLFFAVAVGITQIVLYAIGLPFVVYVFLWRHRGELDKPVVKFRYGLFFAGFRQKRYYWECVVALRKESTVMLAVFGSRMGVAMLAHVALLVFMVQILVQLIGQPYGPGHGILQILDVSAISLCWGTMWSGFFFYTPRPPDQKAALVFLTMAVVIVNTIYMMVLLYAICFKACKEHEDISVMQVIHKKTNGFRDVARGHLSRMVARQISKPNVDTVHVSNPGMTYFAEVEMTGGGPNSTERKHVASKDDVKKDRSWIARRKSKGSTLPERLPGGAAVPSAAQVERKKRLHSLHIRRESLQNSGKTTGAGVHFNLMMKHTDDYEWEDDNIQIFYDNEGNPYSYNPVTGETDWLVSENDT